MESSGVKEQFRGTFPARIDEKGRLKVPSVFLSIIQRQFGSQLFITSVDGEDVRIYPLPVWIEIETKLAAAPSILPARARFINRVNFYGQPGELDKQGRVLIPPRLRDSATMIGDVEVIGVLNYLDVWNRDRFKAKMLREPFTEEDGQSLAEYGI